MKEIKAYIKPIKLPEITQALHHIDGLTSMHTTNAVTEHTWKRYEESEHRGSEDSIHEVVHTKLEIHCDDDVAEKVVETLHKIMHTGLRGDGNIYVSTIDSAVLNQANTPK